MLSVVITVVGLTYQRLFLTTRDVEVTYYLIKMMQATKQDMCQCFEIWCRCVFEVMAECQVAAAWCQTAVWCTQIKLLASSLLPRNNLAGVICYVQPKSHVVKDVNQMWFPAKNWQIVHICILRSRSPHDSQHLLWPKKGLFRTLSQSKLWTTISPKKSLVSFWVLTIGINDRGLLRR